MDLSEPSYDGVQPFDGYGPGFFRIGGLVHGGPQLVHGMTVTPWDGTASALVALAGTVDVILYGTGAEIAHPPGDLRVACEDAGIGLEAMQTPAACRTYNVLVGEGRRVAAAVLPVGEAG
ncbi:Mth938-like domain-containing protein [Jannaschia sp. LMIT008]|uniref:Mth938-like domain-containing protein n=1 Tax=Jannaschia maritima TaxID=3032585 RepID=UPI002811BF3D|nr:Mth938-like domain-containing protein [Jannaschia sp. LMIT008]